MREFYAKYQGYLPAAFFIGGFLFDVLTLSRIDHGWSLLSQAVYLLIIAALLYWEIITPQLFLKPGGTFTKIWAFHVEALHFLFGALLSLYTLFYFKSASSITSWLFMLVMAALLIINELPMFQKRGLLIRASLFSLCLVSYFIYLSPVMIGSIGVGAFLLAIVLSASIYLFFCLRVQRHREPSFVMKNLIVPGIVLQLVFVMLYFVKVLPPVPISLKHIGIYHQVDKHQGHFILSYERDWWRFWQSGAQTFIKRDGDSVYCFLSIFSPTQFKEKIHLDWFRLQRNGYHKMDRISMPIQGGREQGYRGYAYKSNFEQGHWQIRVMTSDDREVGRINFEVVEPAGSARQLNQQIF